MDSSSAPVVLVTGGAAGIGRACVRRFAAAGWAVAVVDQDPARCESVVAELPDALVGTGNVADPGTCAAVVSGALARWGRVDALIANAGIQTPGRLLDMAAGDWQRVLSVNLDGVAHACRAVLAVMVPQRRGSIVIISSINIVQPVPGMAAYDTSKAAVAGLGRQLAVEHGRDGIRVNVLCPGNTITDYHIDRLAARGITEAQIREMTRGYGLLGRAAEPAEIAACAYFLASDEASFVTGQVIAADGGFSLGAAASG